MNALPLLSPQTDRVNADIVVVGSGPGGSLTACLLAETGRDVLLVEEGGYYPQDDCRPFSQREMTDKCRNGGITVAMGRTKIAYVEGRCVGSGSEVNAGLYHRLPLDALERWVEEYRFHDLSMARLEPLFAANERELGIGYLPGQPPGAALKLQEGARRLGWECSEAPRWFRYHRDDPAHPSAGTRQSMTETFLPRFIRAGGRLLANTRVLGMRPDAAGRGWQLHAEHSGRARRSIFRVTVRAGIVFLAAGAVQTPNLLRRSGIVRNVGNSLKLHATIKVVARFPEPINRLDMGVPAHQIKEFAPRYSFAY